MDRLTQILADHCRRYPAMEPTDAVKLIYQNEFGGGHLINDKEKCLQFLRREYESVIQSPDMPLTEEIGNGLVRVHLAALDSHGYSLDTLAADFMHSAVQHSGSLDSFRKKLDLLEQLTKEGAFSFTPEILAHYLESYRQAGYPIVSHSETFRRQYHPAYRIVRKSLIHRKFTL